MAMFVVTVVVFLGVFLGDLGYSQELEYDPHEPYVQPAVKTLTATTTVTATHTVRQVVTSVVSDVDVTTYTPVVTSLATEYSFTGINEGVDTSVITVVSTPVVVVTRTQVTYPVRTFVSVFTTFSTVTVTEDFVFSVTSEATQISVRITPVYSTRVLQQVVATSALQYVTVTTTVTNHQYGYN